MLSLNRRRLLKGLSASGLVLVGAPFSSRHVWANPVFRDFPFSLGVASGDPTSSGVVLWTRIAPEPLNGGGMPNQAVEVEWHIASDSDMKKIVQKGVATAHPELGHAVHVEVEGLEPQRDYYYRFFIGGERSRVGRTRTLPVNASPVSQLRFAACGCQRYEDGYFTAFRHMAQERFDFIYHYGDYIYETRHATEAERPSFARPLPEPTDEAYTLVDYRNRYAAYKIDPDLQAAHASAPFFVSFDDHEVDNNWAGELSEEKDVSAELFRLRKIAAFQAWYENMPLRIGAMPRGAEIQAYRRFTYGDLLGVNILDTRQYRSDQPCGDGGHGDECAEARDPSRTMLGERQENWLYDGFRTAAGKWNVLAQQVAMMRMDRNPDPAVVRLTVDKWDGVAAARDRLFAALRDSRLANPVVLTGDVHNNWAGELKADFKDETSPTLGIEFIGTSISSGGDGIDAPPEAPAILAQNPHIKFFNNQRGFVRHVVTPERWQADFQVLEKVSVPGEPIKTRKSYVIEAGKPALEEA